MIFGLDGGTAGFGAACAIGGALVLAFRQRWHAMWWQGSQTPAPEDAEFERGVYQWGTIAFGGALLVLGLLLVATGVHG